MHPHESLLRQFYQAFAARNADGMAACYHERVFFSDPAFRALRGQAASDMWRMLLSRAGDDFRVELNEVHADDDGGRATWTAYYTFSQTGRRVVNRIQSQFAFADGLIVREFDSFNFWRWARQALGPAGLLLGWTPMLKWAVRRKAMRQLERFRDKLGRTQ